MSSKGRIGIIGSGLAGLGAAMVLSGRSLDIVMLDENNYLGGQYLRRIPEGWEHARAEKMDRLKTKGLRLVRQLVQNDIEIHNSVAVLGFDPDQGIIFQNENGKADHLAADIVVFATGARERFIPFPGWTLPGVISTGAAQIMMKHLGVLPAESLLIAGSGPLPLAVSYEAIKNGARVQGLLDQTNLSTHLKFFPQILTDVGKLWEGVRFASRLIMSGVPLQTRTKILEARGRNGLEEVVTARLDAGGRIVEGSKRVIKTECLAVGHGFIPNIELPGQAGCELEFHPGKGGWVVVTDKTLETTMPGFFAAGETTGVAGGRKSFLEGQLAGWSILKRIGLLSNREYKEKTVRLHKWLRHCRSFGEYINSITRLTPKDLQLIPDRTVICRCENVTMGKVRQAAAEGFDSEFALKTATRCGMGICQGRICGPVISDMVWGLRREKGSRIKPPSFRFPVKAVSLSALSDNENPSTGQGNK